MTPPRRTPIPSPRRLRSWLGFGEGERPAPNEDSALSKLTSWTASADPAPTSSVPAQPASAPPAQAPAPASSPSPASSAPLSAPFLGRRTRERVDRLPPDLLEPVVEPRFSIDGWTYQGTCLEECFPPQVEAELAQTVHMICTGHATAWNYRRAAQLLEGQRAFRQAYAVLEIWSAEGPEPDPTLPKWRARLAHAVLSQGGGPL